MDAKRLVLPKGGFEVQLRLADGTMYGKTGRLNFSDVRVNPATGTREARAELPNPSGGALQPGQFVRVILKGATIPDAVAVPQRAVLENPQGGKIVFTIDDKGTAQPRPLSRMCVDSWSSLTILSLQLRRGFANRAPRTSLRARGRPLVPVCCGRRPNTCRAAPLDV